MATINHQVTCLVTIVSVLLGPATAVAQGQLPGQNLQQEWLEIQTSKDMDARADWWRNLGVEQLEAFIEAGVDSAIADRRGWTPLHSAARYNCDPNVVSALLQAGAAVNVKDRSGDTPLHWAAAENTNVEIVNRLLEAGANVNARDRYGWQPIHTAADRNPNPGVIEALLAAGAERNKRAYFLLFRPRFLVKHNANMSDDNKAIALALLDEIDERNSSEPRLAQDTH
ncbi:MAG: ankyrin repeat domain-containing protein [Pseudomonadota bacterium]